MNYPPLLSRKAASEMTGLSPRYFDRLRREGKLSTYKTLGGQNRFHRDEILKHINATSKELEHADTGCNGGGVKNA
jgi:excisionase family DNA binding protein